MFLYAKNVFKERDKKTLSGKTTKDMNVISEKKKYIWLEAYDKFSTSMIVKNLQIQAKKSYLARSEKFEEGKVGETATFITFLQTCQLTRF